MDLRMDCLTDNFNFLSHHNHFAEQSCCTDDGPPSPLESCNIKLDPSSPTTAFPLDGTSTAHHHPFSPGSTSDSSGYSCGYYSHHQRPSLTHPHSPSSPSSGGSSGNSSRRGSLTPPDSEADSHRYSHSEHHQREVGLVAAGDGLLVNGEYAASLGLGLGPVAHKRLCLVCGDFASGYHYGVASCEACKAFFKRTIQGNIEYTCPVTNECEITKRRRKSCQACRFKKCLRAGMMKEGVRMDRVRGGRQKYKRRVDCGLGLYSKNTFTHQAKHIGSGVISALLVSEPSPLTAVPDTSSSSSPELQTLLTICDLLNRELLLLIGWAKNIPGFSALSLVDQMALLQGGWMEALVLSVVSRSLGSANELVFADNLRMGEEACRAVGLSELYVSLRHLTRKYQHMGLSAEEQVTLKAMALANSDTGPLMCGEAVQRFRDDLHEALQEYERAEQGAEPHRAGRLLMTLPLLRVTAARAADAFRRLHTHHRVPMHKLLLEMLDNKV
ncbi:estrogen-related receptor gamma [Engraulis encrasicolus]|uniref:estrogen-related receptor gamma n=1 Tax=Engraulis encrasicolus TaxID=184585 RepID=UPI002FD50737